jgi:hypothetical protein
MCHTAPAWSGAPALHHAERLARDRGKGKRRAQQPPSPSPAVPSILNMTTSDRGRPGRLTHHAPGAVPVV